jgi:diamine N-acetyltransferase
MAWVNDREVMQYFATRQSAITEDEERGYLKALIGSETDFAYSAFAGDGYVGQCSINKIYWPAKNGRVFLVVKRDQQGKGYGSAMLDALIERAFDQHGLHKLWLIVRRDNRRAQAMYLRHGFDFEGVLTDEYFVKGRFYDMVRMGMVAPAG